MNTRFVSSEKANEIADLLLDSTASFFRNGLGRLLLKLRMKRSVQNRVHPFWKRALENKQFREISSDDVRRLREFRSIYVRGKGRFDGVFPCMRLLRSVVQEQVVLKGKFKVYYVIEFIEKEESRKFVNFYPMFFPNWLGSTDLFKAINTAVVQLHAKHIRIDLRSSMDNLRVDGTAKVSVDGLIMIATLNGENDLSLNIGVEIPNCPIDLVKLELPTD